MSLSIVYITNRKEPHFEWFIWSLKRELRHSPIDIDLIRIDYYGPEKPEPREQDGIRYRICSPMPSPWQGKYRVTDVDYFDASSARNTGLCLATDSYIAFADDLSVLVNGWLRVVIESMQAARITCGAYRKVGNLKVDPEGNITYWTQLPGTEGIDNRYRYTQDGPVRCEGNWLYGCSFCMPVDIMLSVNGFDHSLSGLSFEDCTFGLRLSKAGYQLYYDRRMMTFESEEGHHNPDDVKFKRGNRTISFDESKPGKDDCAWESLAWISRSSPVARGTPDLKLIREQVASGSGFPMHSGPFKWPDGKDLLGR